MMKISLVTGLVLSLMLFVTGYAQVVIDQNDMPAPGDTLRISMTSVVPGNYWKTSFDTVWNFASLEAMSQRVDTFMAASATPTAYQFIFVLLGGANLASPRNVSMIPGLPVSDGFTFFKNSSASFSDMGMAFTVQGIPLPARYDSPDVRYQFPMTPQQTWSSVSSFSIALPGLGYFSTTRTRWNNVDGWGSITTPFGTFDVLRVKSEVTENDSVYIDSLSTGFPVNRQYTEYKWLARNEGLPVLTITEEGALIRAEYRDIPRQQTQSFTVSIGPDTTVSKGTELTVSAVVSGGTPPYRFLWSSLDTTAAVTVTITEPQTMAVFVMDALQNVAFDQKEVYILYPPGLNERIQSRVRIWPNPAHDRIFVETGSHSDFATITIYDISGKLLESTRQTVSADGMTMVETSRLPAGCYFLSVKTGDSVRMTKMMIE